MLNLLKINRFHDIFAFSDMELDRDLRSFLDFVNLVFANDFIWIKTTSPALCHLF